MVMYGRGWGVGNAMISDGAATDHCVPVHVYTDEIHNTKHTELCLSSDIQYCMDYTVQGVNE